MYRNIATFEHRAAFTTWLYRMMTNCVLDAREKIKHHHAMLASTSLCEYPLPDEKYPLSRCLPREEKRESIAQVELREDIAKTLNALDPQTGLSIAAA